MEVKKIDRKLRVTMLDSVRYQLISELLFVRKDETILSDIDLLALVGIWGPMGLSEFCQKAAVHFDPEVKPEQLSLKAQNVRNKLVKLEKRGLIVKTSEARKQVMLDPSLKITAGEPHLLNFNILAIESPKTKNDH